MNRLKTSFGAKLISVILSTVFIAICILCIFIIANLFNNNYYYDNGKTALNESYKEIAEDYANTVIYEYYPLKLDANSDSVKLKKYEQSFSENKTNFSFQLINEQGEILLNNFTALEYEYSGSIVDSLDLNSGESQMLTVNYSICSPLTATDEFYNASIVNKGIDYYKYTVFAVAIISYLLAMALMVFLIYSSGCKKGKNGEIYVKLSYFDKIPTDLLVLIGAVLIIINLYIMPSFYFSRTATFIARYISVFLWCLMLLAFIITVSTRCKCSNPLKMTALYKFGRWLLSPDFDLVGKIKSAVNNLPSVWKIILLLTVFSVADLAFMQLCSKSEYFVVWIIEKILIIPIVLIVVTNYYSLKKGINKISQGDIDFQFNSNNYIWGFRNCADDLNNINNAMQKIIDERMKSERIKTELITNVSHDIKTPLTSIVTYIDLLKKQDVSPKTAAEYVEILDKHAVKLTKLINDLVDASKASSGAMTAEMQKTNADVLLIQTVAEYEDAFEKAGITPIVTVPDKPTYIMADGSLLWRVFDNLLSNICKYSQRDTRVYLSVEQNDNKVYVIFKNISNCALNVSENELLERFVRGDSSRNTEGSGLGLSIAQSLVALQNGELKIFVDGDLFKAVIVFDKIS